MLNNEKHQQPIALRWMVMGSNELFGLSVLLVSVCIDTSMENNSAVFCHVTGEQHFVLCNLRMFAQSTSELHWSNKNMGVLSS